MEFSRNDDGSVKMECSKDRNLICDEKSYHLINVIIKFKV